MYTQGLDLGGFAEHQVKFWCEIIGCPSGEKEESKSLTHLVSKEIPRGLKIYTLVERQNVNVSEEIIEEYLYDLSKTF